MFLCNIIKTYFNWYGISLYKLTNKTLISYKRLDHTTKQYIVYPVGIIFSEFYFYLIAYIEGKDYKYPTVFRLDRILFYESLKSTFIVPYEKEFNDGEFRKRVQFMYSGKLNKVRFIFKGYNLGAVLDGLPTAKVISRDNDVYTLEAETYGKGIYIWLKSQGEKVIILN